MTEKQQEAPERIWIKPSQAWLYAKSEELRDPYDTEQYVRTASLPQPQIPDKRLAEIRERWMYTASPVLPPPAQACADVAYLLSLLQQHTVDERVNSGLLDAFRDDPRYQPGGQYYRDPQDQDS